MSFQELVALTKQHLLEEYNAQSFIWTDKDTYDYFRTLTAPPEQPTIVAAPITQPVYKQQQRSSPPPPKKIETPIIEKPIAAAPPKRQAEETHERQEYDFSAVRSALEEAVHIKIIDTIPDDSLAKRVAQGWKETLPEVILIGDAMPVEHQELLKKISDAIANLGYTSALFTQDIQWELLLTAPHVKMILMTQQSLEKAPELKDKYRFDQARKRHYLDGLLLCPLPAMEKLQSDPSIKANLWQAIRQLLK